MDKWTAAQLARELMREHGVADWTFAYNRRKRALGLCRYEERRIELSIHFVLANDEADVRDTILHEIAHALAGVDAGHGPTWKRVCHRIGARPQRCDSTARMPAGRWCAVCPACGQTYYRHRRPLRGREYACRQCGPKRGRVEFKLNRPQVAAG